jgi:hypothetical protein
MLGWQSLEWWAVTVLAVLAAYRLYPFPGLAYSTSCAAASSSCVYLTARCDKINWERLQDCLPADDGIRAPGSTLDSTRCILNCKLY